jgi:hypothetical protein
MSPKETGLKLFALMMLLMALSGCASPPQLSTALDVQKSSDGLILVKLKVTNLEDRVTVPIALELTGQARTNGQWSKPETLLHPAAFVLNRKEQREITKLWRVQADAVRTTLGLKEQETGHVLKSDKAEKSFTSPR